MIAATATGQLGGGASFDWQPAGLRCALRIGADGKFAHDMLLLEVKKPGESTEPWDYYHVRGVIPAADAALPLGESKCKLVVQR